MADGTGAGEGVPGGVTGGGAPETFVEACARGSASLGDVGDWVERWHAGAKGTTGSLAAHLGMSEPEYALWARFPDALSRIVAKHGREALESRRGVAAPEQGRRALEAAREWYRASGFPEEDDATMAADLICALLHGLRSLGEDPFAAASGAVGSFAAEEIDGRPDEAHPVRVSLSVRTRFARDGELRRLDWRPR